MTKRELNQDCEAVTAAREAAGLTKYRLAKTLRRARSVFTQIENGTRNAPDSLLDEIAKVVGCPPAQLRRKRGEPGGQAAEAADVDVPGVQGGQRAVAEDLLERKSAPAASQEVR